MQIKFKYKKSVPESSLEKAQKQNSSHCICTVEANHQLELANTDIINHSSNSEYHLSSLDDYIRPLAHV